MASMTWLTWGAVAAVGLASGAALLTGCSGTADIGCRPGSFGCTDAGDAADDGVTTDAAPPADAGADVVSFLDAAPPDAGPPSPRFFILVTETPAGAAPANTWGGVLRYDVPDDLQPATKATAIPKTDVADPIGLAFRQTSAEVFVGNRRGMTTGSISRFLYDAKTESFTSNGETLMNDAAGAVMQLAFSHDEKELFVARDGNEITRFTLDSQGKMTKSGAITGLGNMIGVAVSKDGKRLYATQQFSGTIREFALPGGNELSGFPVAGASRPHLMVMDQKSGTLYVSDIQSNKVFALALDSNDDLSLKQTMSGTNPISVALSPDGKELFSTSHNFSPPDVIQRFQVDQSSQWAYEGDNATIDTTTALGGTLVFSASAVPTPPPN